MVSKHKYKTPQKRDLRDSAPKQKTKKNRIHPPTANTILERRKIPAILFEKDPRPEELSDINPTAIDTHAALIQSPGPVQSGASDQSGPEKAALSPIIETGSVIDDPLNPLLPQKELALSHTATIAATLPAPTPDTTPRISVPLHPPMPQDNTEMLPERNAQHDYPHPQVSPIQANNPHPPAIARIQPDLSPIAGFETLGPLTPGALLNEPADWLDVPETDHRPLKSENEFHPIQPRESGLPTPVSAVLSEQGRSKTYPDLSAMESVTQVKASSWNLPVMPNAPSSIDLGDQPGPLTSSFWLNVRAELVLYGATEPDARLSVQDIPISLKPDGTFSLRIALPDGYHEIICKAVQSSGQAERQVTFSIRCETQHASRP